MKSTTEIGYIADYLKAFPFMSMDDYLWKYSAPYLQIMGKDATTTLYLSDAEAEHYKSWKASNQIGGYDDPDAFMNDLGLPVFN